MEFDVVVLIPSKSYMMDFVQNLVAISLLMFKIIEFLRKSSFIIKKTVKKFWLWIFKKLRYVIKGR